MSVLMTLALHFPVAFFEITFQNLPNGQRVYQHAVQTIECSIIPTKFSPSPELIDWLRQWLSENIPEWPELQIVSGATYLGFMMGPSIKDIV